MNIVEEVVLDLNQAPIQVGRTVIWKAKDGDYPVTIVSDLGVGPDGRRYVSVDCGRTGIPLDELSEDTD
jgi:hypothetical protein